jgi:signal transduction histidine kinase
MTLQRRIIITVGGVAVLLALPALYAAVKLDKLRDIAEKTTTTHGAAYYAMGRLQASLADLDRGQRAFMISPSDTTRAVRDSALTGARQHVEALSQAGYADIASDARLHVTRLESEIARIDRLTAAGDEEGAQQQLTRVKPLFAADTIIQAVASEIDRRSTEELQGAQTISRGALTTTLLALAACIFIAVLLGTWATQTVVRPLHRLRRGMAAVAAGEFIVPEGLPYDHQDEMGDLARSFRSMTLKLSELDRLKADFMSIATHELKTPINVITGYAELIQEGVYGEPTAKQLDALTAIQEQSRILAHLVNQLLDVSRLEAGGLSLEITEVSLPDLLDRVRRTFGVLAHKQGIMLHVELDPSAPRTLPGDCERLRDQVLGNLLSNALKFTPEGGEIRVRGWGGDGRVEIEVSDTGSGMPADQLPHVFDKYFQIGEQARSQGAGLGLTIAHDIIAAHGGNIEVSSIEGQGTTFHISLPTQREQVEASRRNARGVVASGV